MNISTFQDFQNMTTKQQVDFIVIQYHKYMNHLRSTTSFIDSYENAFATLLAETLSGKTNTSKDIIIIKRNFILLLNVLLSCCIVYNWYYLMFYVDESGNRINSYQFSLQTLQEKQPIIHVIFKYTLCVLSIVINTLLDTIPSTLRCISLDSNINNMIQFIFLFLFVIFIITVFGKNILDLVGSTELIGFFCITFVLYGIYTFVIEFTDKDPFVITTRMKKYTAFGQMTPLLYILLFFLRIIWSISTVFITSLSNFFHLIFTSFLAILCYSQKPLITTINTIHQFIRKDENRKKDQTVFQNIIHFFITHIYTFLFEVVLIITLLISLFDYSLQMNDTKKLQITMTSFCSTFIFLLCFIIYQRFTYIKKTNTKTNTNTNTNIPSVSIPVNMSNQLSSLADPVKKLSSLADSAKQLSSLSDPAKQLSSLSDPAKQLSSLSDPAKQLSSLSDSAKQLSALSDPMKQLSSLSDSAKQLSSLSDPMKQLSSLSDPMKQLSSLSDSAKQLSSLSDSAKQLSSLSDPMKQLSSTLSNKSSTDSLSSLLPCTKIQ